VSEGGLEPRSSRVFPDSALEYAGRGEIPCSGVHANMLAGTSQPVSSGLARLRPQDRGRRHSLRRECRAPAKSAGALPVACGSRCAMQRAPRSADLCTGRPPRQADDTGVSTTAAGPESARDIRRSAVSDLRTLWSSRPRITGCREWPPVGLGRRAGPLNRMPLPGRLIRSSGPDACCRVWPTGCLSGEAGCA
jgi:hypothetical protein